MKRRTYPDRANSDKDASSLDRQFRAHADWLLARMARGFRGRTQDAEDIVQESFIRLSRYPEESRSEHPRALLIKIAGNLSYDHHRREAARCAEHHLPFDDSHDAMATPADQHANVALKQALLALSPAQRDTFLLSRFTPMTQAQIADHLGVSVKTIEWRLQQALAVLLDHFKV